MFVFIIDSNNVMIILTFTKNTKKKKKLTIGVKSSFPRDWLGVIRLIADKLVYTLFLQWNYFVALKSKKICLWSKSFFVIKAV
jgi:hypothetical protein